MPISLAGVAGPCPQCGIQIKSPDAPIPAVPEALQQLSECPPNPPVQVAASAPSKSAQTIHIEPRGGARPPQINIRSVGTIDWASEDAREAARRVRKDLPALEKIERHLDSAASSGRIETMRAILSVAAVITMAGTVFFMAKTGWGNANSSDLRAKNATSAEQSAPRYVSVPVPPPKYPWREPLPEREKEEKNKYLLD